MNEQYIADIKGTDHFFKTSSVGSMYLCFIINRFQAGKCIYIPVLASADVSTVKGLMFFLAVIPNGRTDSWFHFREVARFHQLIKE